MLSKNPLPRTLVRHRGVTHDARFRYGFARNVTFVLTKWHPHTVAVIIRPWIRSDNVKVGEKETEVATRQCERYAEKLDEDLGLGEEKLYFVSLFRAF